MLVLADAGAASLIKAYFNNTWPAGGKSLTLKLFATNVTPTDASTAGSFTEAAGGGYAAKTLTNGSWTESNVGGSDPLIIENVYGPFPVGAEVTMATSWLLVPHSSSNLNG